MDKVLSEPIRPHFVIANITMGDMNETLRMITKRVGSRVPIIVSRVTGVLGKEACSDKAGEVKKYVTTDDDGLDKKFAILLTIGYLPGMKVEVIPVIQSLGNSYRSNKTKKILGWFKKVEEHVLTCISWVKKDSQVSYIIQLLLDRFKFFVSVYFRADGLYYGSGIKTGDFFQVYSPDLKKAEASLNALSSQLKNLTVNSREKKTEVVGGFVFACAGRGDMFFGRPNADGTPFLQNFPDLPFGGIFCDGEIGRSISMEVEEEEERRIRKCLHVYCSLYLIVSSTYSSS